MEAVEYPVFYDSCPNDSWYMYVHAYIHTVSDKPRVGERGVSQSSAQVLDFSLEGKGQSTSNPTAARQ
jgi:hypothetical protein